MRLTVTDDTGAIVQALEARLDGLSDFRPLWNQLRGPWEDRSRRMFATNGRDTETPWRDYTQAELARYVPWKMRVLGITTDPNRQLLRWGGSSGERLRPSLENTRHPEAIWTETATVLTVGSSSPGAAPSEYGKSRAKKWMGNYMVPQRRILGFGAQFARDVSVEIGVFAASAGARRAGFSSADLMGLMRRGRA
jgi:hypothetical protein